MKINIHENEIIRKQNNKIKVKQIIIKYNPNNFKHTKISINIHINVKINENIKYQ